MGSNPYTYNQEKKIINAPTSMPSKALNLISEQSKNNILKIINQKNEAGTGFFCLIPFPDKLHPLPTLITNNHVLNKTDIDIGKIIKFSSEEKDYQIRIDNQRRCYTNEEEYDTTIIEIKPEDGIKLNKFLEIDEEIFNIKANEILEKSSVYVIHYPNGSQNEISFGKIKSISLDNINILHLCNTLPGSSGGPILNMINYKVIGIHKGAEENKNWNLGTLLQLPIKKFNEVIFNKENKKNSKNEINLNNENNEIIKNNANDKKEDNVQINESYNILADNEFSEFSLFNKDVQEEIYFNNNNKKNKLPEIQNNNMSNNNINISYGNINDDNFNNLGNNNNINIQNVINNNISNNQNKNLQNNVDINNKGIIKESYLIVDNNNDNNEIINDENIVDEITIIYSKTNVKSKNMFDKLVNKVFSTETVSEFKLFGEQFIKNNINKCKIIIDGREYKLASYIKEIYNEYIYFLELKLTGVSKVKDMSYMFCGCLSLTAVSDIDKLDTKNVISMGHMFSGCESLQSLPDISKWNTSNVVYMDRIFSNCILLTSLPDISKWDTREVIDMTFIFSGCELLLSLPDISKWDTSEVLSFKYMFSGCQSLRVLPDISKWNTSNVKNMECMFNSCKNLISLPDISKWDTGNVKSFHCMFRECESLQSLPDISKWNTSKVIYMDFMFDSCKNLISLPDISRWNTFNLQNTDYMFKNCSSLKSLPDLSKWDTSNLKNKINMFWGCRSNLNVPQKLKENILLSLFKFK